MLTPMMKTIQQTNIRTMFANCLVIATLLAAPNIASADDLDLTELDFEDLMNVEVTSVNRHAESLFNSAAAVYVISDQDIRRSGATNIPEALRMVPGLNVAQIDAGKWMVGSRSFGSRFANNLQVMVDGRSIYTPAFSGVYWEQLDVVMKDIDRIEVVRGPGATLWGANAVNGVINIITKSASETQGGYTMLRAGNEQNGAAFRYGGKINEQTYARAYVKYRSLDDQALANGQDSYDSQRNQEAGFRIDTNLDAGDKLTLQGDVYGVDTKQVESIPSLAPPYLTNTNNTRDSHGWNLLGRWEKPLSVSSDMTLQMYLDYYSVDELALSPHDNTTFDVDFQHHNTLNETHDLIWGLGYTGSKTDITSTSASAATDQTVDRYRFSAFVQDEISLIKDKLTLTLGSKFEKNNVTGFEYQPNARMLWKPTDNQSVWGAVSRSVRTPSIGEESIRLNLATLPPGSNPLLPPIAPINITTVADLSNFDSEKVYTYELGYRIQATPDLSFDAALYHSDYKNMRNAIVAGIPAFTGNSFDTLLALTNDNNAISRGVELSTTWQARKDLRFVLDYAVVNNDIATIDGLEPDSTPKQKLSLRSMFDVTSNVNLDMWVRYVNKTNVRGFISNTLNDSVDVPSHWNMDLRLGWQVNDKLALSVVGKNLLHKQRLEGANPIFNNQVVEVEQSVFAMVEWQF